jgi:hypothetical protein
MKVELIEQLGITPTPGGIDKLLQLQDTQNYYNELIINPSFGRMQDIEGLIGTELERNDPYVGVQIRKRFNDGGIVGLSVGGSLSSGFDTDDWELDDYNQQIQELKEEKRSLGFSGENSQRKTRINQALRGLRLERLKKRFRGFGSGIAETLGRVNVADTTGMAQPPSDAQLDQFAEAVDAGSDTAARDILGGDVFGTITGGISDLLQNARELRESSAATGPGLAMPFFTGVQEDPLFEGGVIAAEAPIDETGYALPPEVQEEQWVTLDPLRLGWRIRTAPHGEFSGNLEKQFGNFSEEYSPWKARNKRYNEETRQWEFRAPPDYMEKKAWISAMRGPLRSRNKMAEGGIVNLAGGGGARGGWGNIGDLSGPPKGTWSGSTGSYGGGGNGAFKEFGQTIPWADIGLGAATGGVWNLFKNVGQWGANKWEGVGSRDRLLSELNNAWANASPTEQDEISKMMDKIENMSTDEFQTATEGYAIPGYDPDTGQTFKTLPGQDMRAGMTGASAMMMMPVTMQCIM